MDSNIANSEECERSAHLPVPAQDQNAVARATNDLNDENVIIVDIDDDPPVTQNHVGSALSQEVSEERSQPKRVKSSEHEETKTSSEGNMRESGKQFLVQSLSAAFLAQYCQ
mmetsp:Transcript_15924/g.18461  ORF Transcript_15924/g.18461 Transcript_15924/m.18461 type:complete len:112 (-) Transcript_15924:672-1007(-)